MRAGSVPGARSEKSDGESSHRAYRESKGRGGVLNQRRLLEPDIPLSGGTGKRPRLAHLGEDAPFPDRGHLGTIVDEVLLLGGHVPGEIEGELSQIVPVDRPGHAAQVARDWALLVGVGVVRPVVDALACRGNLFVGFVDLAHVLGGVKLCLGQLVALLHQAYTVGVVGFAQPEAVEVDIRLLRLSGDAHLVVKGRALGDPARELPLQVDIDAAVRVLR